MRLLVEHTRVVAEGASAEPVASAFDGGAGTGSIVCIVSGGKIRCQSPNEILRRTRPLSPKCDMDLEDTSNP